MSDPNDIESLIDEAFASAETREPETAEDADVEEAEIVDTDDEAEADAPEDTDEEDAEDDGEEAPEEDAGDDKPRMIRVRVNGEDRLITEQEAANSYAGQEFIRQEIDRTKSLQRDMQAALQAVMQKSAQIDEFHRQVQEQGFIPEPQPPEWDDNDPVGSAKREHLYNQQFRAYRQQQAQLEQVREQRQAIEQRQRAEQLAQMAKHGEEYLAEKLPEYRDPQKREALQSAMVQYAVSAGYRPEELADVVDPRAVLMLHKAMNYDRLMAEGKAKAAQPKAAAKTVKPGARRNVDPARNRKQRIERAAARGSIEDIVNAAFRDIS